MSLHVRGLSKDRGAQFSVHGDVFNFDGIPNYSDVQARTWINKHHKVRVTLYEGEDGTATRCDGLHAHWRPAKNLIRIVSPVKCGAAAWWRRKFYSTSMNATWKVADHVKIF